MRGLYPTFPQDLVIECPAIVDQAGLHPVALGEYPPGITAFLQTQVCSSRPRGERGPHNSKQIALQALLADPTVQSPAEV